MTRSTSRHMTLPEPSQMVFTGASLKIRAMMPLSTYPLPPKTSIISPVSSTARLQIQNFAAGVIKRFHANDTASSLS